MTVAGLAKTLDLKIIAGSDGLEREVSGGYCGDLLSWVMGRASDGDAWITVMGTLNAVAVAVLADISCIILAENSPLDDEAKKRADAEGVPVLQGDMTQFSLCCAVSGQLKG